MKKCLLCVAVIALLVAADDKPKADDVKEKLQGTWTVVSEEVNGRKTAEDKIKGSTLTIEGNKLSFNHDGKAVRTGTYAIELSQKPAHLDITNTPPPKDAVTKMIFQLDGDVLKLGAGKSEYGEHPKSFEEASVIIMLKREKK